jgi:thioesterase domain-containing protein
MAQQLQKLGREVPLLVVIDSVPANTGGGSHRLSPRYNGKLIRNIPRWAANDLALNFSWSGLYRRASHKLKAFIEGLPIARRSKEELAQHRAKVFVTAGAYSESTNAFMQTFALTLAKYVPKPYSGQVVLYKARTDPLFKVREIDLKWRKIASRLDVVQVNGTHNTVLDESNVPLLAKDLNARLKECRQRDLQDSPEAVTGSQYALRGRSEMPAGLETV